MKVPLVRANLWADIYRHCLEFQASKSCVSKVNQHGLIVSNFPKHVQNRFVVAGRQ